MRPVGANGRIDVGQGYAAGSASKNLQVDINPFMRLYPINAEVKYMCDLRLASYHPAISLTLWQSHGRLRRGRDLRVCLGAMASILMREALGSLAPGQEGLY